jgi:LmbE family N-acetylglucosaminyl deacetylase
MWITGFLLVSDFSVPTRDARAFRHALVIFPHADDEAVTCGGFLHRLARGGCAVTLVILTKGERGTPNATLDPRLKDIRAREAQKVSAILGISRCIQEDFGDGELHARRQELTAFVEATIARERPDLLITYDLAGLYGHTDHVTCSEVVTALHASRFQAVPLWYVTFLRRVLKRVTPPKHMTLAADVTGKTAPERRAFPTHKVFIGASVLPKIKAWYAYESQRASLTEGIRRFLPIWFFLSMALFEYFAEVS